MREFVEIAATHLGTKLAWLGIGINEREIDVLTGKCIVEIDPRYFWLSEVDILLGDASKAKKNWVGRLKFSLASW